MIRFRFKASIIFFPLLCAVRPTGCFSAENDQRYTSLSGIWHYGHVWAHRARVEHLTQGHTQGAEVSLETQTDGTKWWHSVHGYPQTGFSAIYFDLANPKVIGNAASLLGYINFPLLRTKRFQCSIQTGAGLGYLSRRFDPVTDHKNMGIGSYVNSAIRFALRTRYRVPENIFLHFNYGITHFSNAAYRLPNLGINNITFSAGASWAFSEPEKFLAPEIPAPDKRWMLELVYGGGVKENFPPGGSKYFAHTIYAQVMKPLSHKSRLGAGADFFYDLSLLRFVQDATSKSERQLGAMRCGLHAGYEMQVHHFTLLFHMGYYIVDQTKIDSAFYHRYGLKYDLGKRLFINLTLKTHWARADYAELGLGWRIRI
jgi:hypothetical protein